ncbi:MAG: transporter substrate-binding domain-containing protein [Clostridia bacterium]|nr:transporter substrate-binding domain-containing protein [Clostridia bacterium]
MKKIIAMLLAVMMVLAIAACGNQEAKKVTITSPDDFKGLKVSVQTATTAHDDLQARNEAGLNANIMPYEKVTQCFDDLSLGRVDAVYVDSVVAGYYLAGEESKYQVVWESSEGEPMGFCLSKDNDELGNILESCIDMLYYNGTMAEIAKKHFGYDVTEGVRTVTEEPVIDTSALKTIQEGKLLIGAEVGYPPMEYTDETGLEYIGFDIDIGKELGKLLGLEVEVVNTAWDGIFEGLGKNQYDVVISAVSILPDRQEKYFMTEPYIANKLVIVTLKDAK